jgi:hypothetical protein
MPALLALPQTRTSFPTRLLRVPSQALRPSCVGPWVAAVLTAFWMCLPLLRQRHCRRVPLHLLLHQYSLPVHAHVHILQLLLSLCCSAGVRTPALFSTTFLAAPANHSLLLPQCLLLRGRAASARHRVVALASVWGASHGRSGMRAQRRCCQNQRSPFSSWLCRAITAVCAAVTEA